jgi:hypothetical protein
MMEMEEHDLAQQKDRKMPAQPLHPNHVRIYRNLEFHLVQLAFVHPSSGIRLLCGVESHEILVVLNTGSIRNCLRFSVEQ